MALSDRSHHWDDVYETRNEIDLTWFEAKPTLSVELIRKHAALSDPVIDVGGGTSRLVDCLVDTGYRTVTILDLSDVGMNVSKRRLVPRADQVRWVTADVTRWPPDQTYALWHDRAVFHFLTTEDDRKAYVTTMLSALRDGGKAIIMTFAEDGPEKCSGLPVMRYSPAELIEMIEAIAPGALSLVESQKHVHVTPKGNEQRFQVSVLEKTGR